MIGSQLLLDKPELVQALATLIIAVIDIALMLLHAWTDRAAIQKGLPREGVLTPDRTPPFPTK